MPSIFFLKDRFSLLAMAPKKKAGVKKAPTKVPSMLAREAAKKPVTKKAAADPKKVDRH